MNCEALGPDLERRPAHVEHLCELADIGTLELRGAHQACAVACWLHRDRKIGFRTDDGEADPRRSCSVRRNYHPMLRQVVAAVLDDVAARAKAPRIAESFIRVG
jgi:hypothetical protein